MDREPGTGPTVGPILGREELAAQVGSQPESITAPVDSVEQTRDEGTLPGERGTARVAGSRTLQARITTGVGLAASVLVGLAFLGWYAGRPAREAEAAAAEQQRRTDAALSSDLVQFRAYSGFPVRRIGRRIVDFRTVRAGLHSQACPFLCGGLS